MVQPEYDFFATDRPASLDPAVLPGGPKPPAVNRFGSPEAAAPPVPVASPLAAPPTAAPAPFPVAPGSGYQPGRVNQFGTPMDVEAAPIGPYAAPGVAAAPIDQPGLVSTWDPAAHAAGRAAARQAHAKADPASTRPGAVLAVGILAIIDGVLVLLGTIVAWIMISSLTGMIADAGGRVSASTTSSINASLFVNLAIGTLYLVMGIGVVRGSRTWFRVLRILVTLGALLSLLMLLSGVTLLGILSVALSGVMLWLMWNAKVGAWLAAG